MNLKQLHYFLTIVEEGQITAAAKKLHIAQPPLSYQLRLLEEELGVQLMKRGSRNITLTSAGKLLKKRAEQILSLTTSTARELELYGSGTAGTLSIGTISSSSSVMPNESILSFARDYPEIRFDIHEGNSFEVLDMLDKGIIDVGIVRTPFTAEEFTIHYAQPEPIIAVFPPGEHVGEKKGEVSLSDLQDKPLIIYRRFNELINQTFAKEGITPYIRCRNDDARTTLNWTKAGFGIGIVPLSALSAADREILNYKTVLADELYTKLAIIWKAQPTLSPLTEKFVQLFMESIGSC